MFLASVVFLCFGYIATEDFFFPSGSGVSEKLSISEVGFREGSDGKSTAPIESITVGQRVLAHNPEVTELERSGWVEPDWNQWIKLTLLMPKPDGSELKITMLRPESWVMEHLNYHIGKMSPDVPPSANDSGVVSSNSRQIADTARNDSAGSIERKEQGRGSLNPVDEAESSLVPLSPLRPVYRELIYSTAFLKLKGKKSGFELRGLSIQMDLPELGLTGNAILTNIEPAPAIKTGKGRVVTATFHHSSGDVIDLTVGDQNSESNTETIGTTSNHPFWSVDRQKYIQAGELKIGETLKSFKDSGDKKVVISQLPRPGPTPVYNLEVHGEHVYYVGLNGILVHNSYVGDDVHELDPVVYRLIRDGEMDYATKGLSARPNSVLKDPDDIVYSITHHVGWGTKAKIKSPLISASRDLDYLRKWQALEGGEIVQVDLRHVVGAVFDVSTEAGRAKWLRPIKYFENGVWKSYRRPHNLAKGASEVLILGDVLPPGVSGL